MPMQTKSACPLGTQPHQLAGKVGVGSGGDTVEREPRRSEYVHRFRQGSAGIDQQVVADFKLGLIEGTGERRRTAGASTGTSGS